MRSDIDTDLMRNNNFSGKPMIDSLTFTRVFCSWIMKNIICWFKSPFNSIISIKMDVPCVVTGRQFGHFLIHKKSSVCPAVRLYKNAKSPLNAFSICFSTVLCKRSLKSLINVNFFTFYFALCSSGSGYWNCEKEKQIRSKKKERERKKSKLINNSMCVLNDGAAVRANDRHFV